jgi:hypothetical protein
MGVAGLDNRRHVVNYICKSAPGLIYRDELTDKNLNESHE